MSPPGRLVAAGTRARTWQPAMQLHRACQAGHAAPHRRASTPPARARPAARRTLILAGGRLVCSCSRKPTFSPTVSESNRAPLCGRAAVLRQEQLFIWSSGHGGAQSASQTGAALQESSSVVAGAVGQACTEGHGQRAKSSARLCRRMGAQQSGVFSAGQAVDAAAASPRAPARGASKCGRGGAATPPAATAHQSVSARA